MADIGELVIRVRAVTEGVETVINDVTRGIQGLVTQIEGMMRQASFSSTEKGMEDVGAAAEKAGEKMAQFGEKSQEGTKQAEVDWKDIHKAATSALEGIAKAVDHGITVAQAYQTAMMGLQSVATQNGVGSLAIKEAVDQVSDAFLDSASAANAYKNLLTRGFSLDQATNTILRLKEAAAFGRQANLGFAQSVVTATEGIKSENNALVSNAGVTKSVVKMWQDYAKARGVAQEAFPLPLAA